VTHRVPKGFILPFRVPTETMTEHRRQTGHRRYEWDLDRDTDMFRALTGREPTDSDTYIGCLLCVDCTTRVFNR